MNLPLGLTLLALSGCLTVVAYRYWRRRLDAFVRRRGRGADLADTDVPDWPGLIGLFLPRRLRRVWNFLLLWVCYLLFGALPHGLALYAIVKPGQADTERAVYYVASLGWWLLILSLPALAIASHRLAMERTIGKPS